MEVFLQPGELYFGDGRTRVRTLLGSCVAIAVWHPRLRIGGLCHYMLPSRAIGGRWRGRDHGHALDGRYGDEAMLLFLRHMEAAGTHPQQYEAKLFGGGRMFDGAVVDIPYKNVVIARELVARHGLRLRAEHLGGSGHRNLQFEIWSGNAYLRFWGQDAEQRVEPSR